MTMMVTASGSKHEDDASESEGIAVPQTHVSAEELPTREVRFAGHVMQERPLRP